MTIKAVKPGGWGPNFVPTPTELAQIDQRVAQYGLDNSSAGDTVMGPLSFKQDPFHAGVHPTLVGDANVTAPGAVIGTGPGGGSLVCAASVPSYSATRTRRVRYSTLELTRSVPSFSGSTITLGCAPVVDTQSGGITQSPFVTGGFSIQPNAQISIPITKPHHGATITSVSAYYYYTNSTGGTVTFVSGKITLEKVNISTGAVTSSGPSTAVPPAVLTPNTALAATISGLSVAVDLTSFVYRLMIQDIECNGVSRVVWTAVEVNYSGIPDEGFSQ